MSHDPESLTYWRRREQRAVTRATLAVIATCAALILLIAAHLRALP